MYDVASKQADQKFPVKDQQSGVVLYCIVYYLHFVTG